MHITKQMNRDYFKNDKEITIWIIVIFILGIIIGSWFISELRTYQVRQDYCDNLKAINNQ